MTAEEVLPSWADTPTRAAILDFVRTVTEAPDAVPIEARIAVFDNDGTLWTEKPMPTQLHYIVQQWKAAAEADPSLAERQPYKAAVTGDLSWLAAAVDKHYLGNDSDLKTMIGAIVATTYTRHASVAATSTIRGQLLRRSGSAPSALIMAAPPRASPRRPAAAR